MVLHQVIVSPYIWIYSLPNLLLSCPHNHSTGAIIREKRKKDKRLCDAETFGWYWGDVWRPGVAALGGGGGRRGGWRKERWVSGEGWREGTETESDSLTSRWLLYTERMNPTALHFNPWRTQGKHWLNWGKEERVPRYLSCAHLSLSLFLHIWPFYLMDLGSA